ncbi:MAG: metalloregulator ArsR/SmtB family transcription factor [Acidimicrobiia bacterium]|nr:metalloregulator ArsR/SmtB family transcription factor [Acidimicrobiia bacterium]
MSTHRTRSTRGASGSTPLDTTLRALADPTRRRILVMLRDGEYPAGTVARAFSSMSRPAVSQHLRVLHDAALVEVRRDGNRRLYRARPEGLEAAWRFIEDMWQGSLQRLKVAAERAEAEAGSSATSLASAPHTEEAP